MKSTKYKANTLHKLLSISTKNTLCYTMALQDKLYTIYHVVHKVNVK